MSEMLQPRLDLQPSSLAISQSKVCFPFVMMEHERHSSFPSFIVQPSIRLTLRLSSNLSLNRSYSSSIPLVSNFYCSARLLLHGKRNEHKNRRGLAHRPVGARNQMREGGKKKKKLTDRETLTLLDAMSLTERCVWIVSNWSRHQSSSSSVSTASRV